MTSPADLTSSTAFPFSLFGGLFSDDNETVPPTGLTTTEPQQH